MLTSFAPRWGLHGSSTYANIYTFAHEIGDITRGGQFDTGSITRLDNQDGSYDMTGTNRLFVDKGQLDTTLDMNEYWLKNGSMGDYVTAHSGNAFAARDAAIIDLLMWVVFGGQGKLLDTMADGTILWSYAKCLSWKIVRTAGAATVRPQLSFVAESGFWTRQSDNVGIPLF